MIDLQVMYEHRARFMCAAEGSIKELFDKVVTRASAPKRKNDSRGNRLEDADLLVDDELGFAKDRTMSRSVYASTFSSTILLYILPSFSLVVLKQCIVYNCSC